MFITPPIGLMRKKGALILPPVHIGSSAANNGASGDSTLTVGKPPGTADGDLMVAFIQGNGISVSFGPTGWTQQAFFSASLDGTQTWMYAYTKPATNSEPAFYNWGMSGGAGYELATISTYRPVHATQIEAINQGQLSGNTNVHNALNITTTHAETMILSAWFMNRSGTNSASVLTMPSGMTQRAAISASSFGRPDLFIDVYEEVLSTPGLYTGKQLISQPNTWSGGCTLGIRALGT